MTELNIRRRLYRRTLKRFVPAAFHQSVVRIMHRLRFMPIALHAEYSFWRVKKLPTQIMGPQYHRSRDILELNITYACNLTCYNCDRSCQQAPTGMHMTVAQIERFVSESVAADYRWTRISVIGGEPTIHPQFFEILSLLRKFRDEHSPKTVVEIRTNGYGPLVQSVISRIPSDIVIRNSGKDAKKKANPDFASFNISPGDVEAYKGSDFRNACYVTQYCGMGLGPTGYYQCGVATGMDRILGLNLGRQSLPQKDDDMHDLLDRLCRDCGYFKRRSSAFGYSIEAPFAGPVSSKTWDKAYDSYRRKKPLLVIYGQSTDNGDSPEEKDAGVELPGVRP